MTDIKENAQLNSFHIPRVMIAATGSGSGKTLITCGILEILKEKGVNLRAYKCGPDYIDPMFHKKVLGIESENLDSFFLDDDGIRHILCKDGDSYAVMEGVMGLYDGLYTDSDKTSCYDIARITGTPVILVVDAAGMGRTVISLIKGILGDDSEGLIKGLILNRMSESYFKNIRPCLESELVSSGYPSVKVLGCVPKTGGVEFDSRHLGLKMPDEISDIKEKIRTIAEVIKNCCDICGMVDVMEETAEITCNIMSTKADIVDSEKPVLAVAYDEAFCFYYKDNLDRFTENGVKIRFFSPIHDESLPEDASGILLGGGYPELYLDKLSANTKMLCSVREAILKGVPSLAECGGFMYLHRYVSDKNGRKYKLADVIDGECTYSGHLVRFGYMQIDHCIFETDNRLLNSLIGIKGHEFHYYDSTSNGEACVAIKPDSTKSWKCVMAGENFLWGYPHFYYGSHDTIVDEFTDCMRKYGYGQLQQVFCK